VGEVAYVRRGRAVRQVAVVADRVVAGLQRRGSVGVACDAVRQRVGDPVPAAGQADRHVVGVGDVNRAIDGDVVVAAAGVGDDHLVGGRGLPARVDVDLRRGGGLLDAPRVVGVVGHRAGLAD